MSSSRVETLLVSKAKDSQYGWMRSTDAENNHYRCIRIGNVRNCNGDGLICDHSISSELESVMKKYNVNNYRMNNIHNEYEFSFEVKITEEEYNKFLENLE